MVPQCGEAGAQPLILRLPVCEPMSNVPVKAGSANGPDCSTR